MRLGEAREALGEDASRAVRLRAGEAADGDPEPDSPVHQSSTDLPGMKDEDAEVTVHKGVL
jgi:hypothetical protein